MLRTFCSSVWKFKSAPGMSPSRVNARSRLRTGQSRKLRKAWGKQGGAGKCRLSIHTRFTTIYHGKLVKRNVMQGRKWRTTFMRPRTAKIWLSILCSGRVGMKTCQKNHSRGSEDCKGIRFDHFARSCCKRGWKRDVASVLSPCHTINTQGSSIIMDFTEKWRTNVNRDQYDEATTLRWGISRIMCCEVLGEVVQNHFTADNRLINKLAHYQWPCSQWVYFISQFVQPIWHIQQIEAIQHLYEISEMSVHSADKSVGYGLLNEMFEEHKRFHRRGDFLIFPQLRLHWNPSNPRDFRSNLPDLWFHQWSPIHTRRSRT